MLEIKEVREIAKQLEDISIKKGYNNLELAYLIFAMAEDLDNVTDEQIRKCEKLISYLDEVIDEGVKCDLYDILNK